MPSWGDIFGSGSVAEQLLVWGLLNQLLGDFLGPTLELVRQEVNQLQPTGILTPADLADAVVRGIKAEADAAAEAARNGIDAGRFHDLVLGAGEPPGLQTVLEMYRRGFIPWDDAGPEVPSVERAIKTGRIYNYWSGPIKDDAYVPISVGEAVNALLRGQTDEATALSEAKANGITPERFKILLDSAGRPPAPGELIELLRRKLIPLEGVGPGVVSFQQGIFEGDAKDKWWQQYAKLAIYVPPPRTVTTLLKTGSITDAEAQTYWQDAGITPELSAAYAKSARGEKLAGSKQLAEQTVLTLYETQAIDQPTAAAHLGSLGYDGSDIAFLLELADLQRELKIVNGAVTRVGTLYVAHKITRHAASESLAALGLAGPHADHMLELWDIEAAANVKALTQGEITAAFEYGNMTQDEATTELLHIGYTPFDAWVLLSNKNKGPLPGKPAQGPAGPGVNP